MLRLAAIRSTRRCTPSAVRLGRFKSTGEVASASTPAASPEAPPAAIPETINKGRKTKTKAVKQTSAAPQPQSWKTLGLKYNPNKLPIVQELDRNIRDYDEEEYARTLVHGRGFHRAYHHPRTHDVPVANVHFRCHQIPIMNLFIHFATHAAASLGIPVSRTVSLPTQRRLWTVLRSPFAHKKSQENFERRVHKRAIKAWDAHPDVVQRWLDYLRKNAMPGVGMRVTTWQRMPLSVGATTLAHEKNAEVRPSGAAPQQVERLAKKIIEEERANASATTPSA